MSGRVFAGWIATVAAGLVPLVACAADAPKAPEWAAGMTNPPPGRGFFAGANFWNIDWQGQHEYFRGNVNFSRDRDPWRADLIADLRPYRVLRFMDWNDTNAAATRQSRFGTRKQKGAAQNQPVALEWQIDLCNRADADCWINVHHTATAPDFRQMAQLIKAGLKPSLRVYVEWSNEVWNAGFPQHAYAENAGRQLGLSGGNAAAAYTTYMSVRLFEEFATVFAGHPQRLVKVLAGQAAWTGPCDAQAAALSDSAVNPRGTRPDAYAIAPYIQGESLAELRGAIATARGWVEQHMSCAGRMGVPLITYEGGSDSFSLGDRCERLQRDPGMRQLYAGYLDTLAAAGLRGPFMQYTHSGSCWGLKTATGDPPDASPKYQGLTDWLLRVEEPRAAPAGRD